MLPGVLSVAGGGVGVRSGVGPTPTTSLVLTRAIGLYGTNDGNNSEGGNSEASFKLRNVDLD